MFNPEITKIGISAIRQFDKEASQIPDIIKLTLGEPNFDTPTHIKNAAIQAIQHNHTHYTPNAGIQKLRETACAYYNKKFNLNYTAHQVITTVGATQAINVTLQTLLQPGECILVPTPVFPIYMPIANINQGEFVTIDTSDDHFTLTPEKLENTIIKNTNKKFKAIILVYPSNPTGVTYTKKQLEALADVAKKYNLWLICDEIYAELTYDKTHYSISNYYPEKSIVITGLSKSHAMTGWRIGFVFGPQQFIEQAEKAHQYMVTTPTSISQYAALEAMQNGENDCEQMLVEYRKRRNYLCDELQKLGFTFARPDGAFYIFAKIPSKCPQDSWEFVRDLAEKAKVAVIPGSAFGKGGDNYIRISYAASMEDLITVIQRLKQYMTLYN